MSMCVYYAQNNGHPCSKRRTSKIPDKSVNAAFIYAADLTKFIMSPHPPWFF